MEKIIKNILILIIMTGFLQSVDKVLAKESFDNPEITMEDVITDAKADREEKVELNGKCERVARDCIEPGETRTINGSKVYRECWRYKDAYRDAQVMPRITAQNMMMLCTVNWIKQVAKNK